MDRNSTIGLVLIGLIITVFSVMNQPSEAELKAAQKKEAAAAQKADKKDKQAKTVAKTPSQSNANNASQVVKKGEITTKKTMIYAFLKMATRTTNWCSAQ